MHGRRPVGQVLRRPRSTRSKTLTKGQVGENLAQRLFERKEIARRNQQGRIGSDRRRDRARRGRDDRQVVGQCLGIDHPVAFVVRGQCKHISLTIGGIELLRRHLPGQRHTPVKTLGTDSIAQRPGARRVAGEAADACQMPVEFRQPRQGLDQLKVALALRDRPHRKQLQWSRCDWLRGLGLGLGRGRSRQRHSRTGRRDPHPISGNTGGDDCGRGMRTGAQQAAHQRPQTALDQGIGLHSVCRQTGLERQGVMHEGDDRQTLGVGVQALGKGRQGKTVDHHGMTRWQAGERSGCGCAGRLVGARKFAGQLDDRNRPPDGAQTIDKMPIEQVAAGELIECARNNQREGCQPSKPSKAAQASGDSRSTTRIDASVWAVPGPIRPASIWVFMRRKISPAMNSVVVL